MVNTSMVSATPTSSGGAPASTGVRCTAVGAERESLSGVSMHTAARASESTVFAPPNHPRPYHAMIDPTNLICTPHGGQNAQFDTLVDFKVGFKTLDCGALNNGEGEKSMA